MVQPGKMRLRNFCGLIKKKKKKVEMNDAKLCVPQMMLLWLVLNPTP